MKWFGSASWCPITELWERVDAPAGEGCVDCRLLIEADDEGFVFLGLPAGYTAMHRRCFEEALELPKGPAPNR